MVMPKILVVDDEEDLCEILKFNLEIEGYEVDTGFQRRRSIEDGHCLLPVAAFRRHDG